MRNLTMRLANFGTLLILLNWISCGGSGGGGGTPPPPPPTLTITTAQNLSPTLSGQTYSATLQASGGSGALHWSIAPLSPTTAFVDGLSMDANTGVLSGTPNFVGTAGFNATVTDAASHSATKSFTLTAFQRLQGGAPQTINALQFGGISANLSFVVVGGVPPLTYSVTGGALPFGARLDRGTGVITGSSNTAGTYNATVTVQDSFSPPESATQQVTINVAPPQLAIAFASFPSKLLLNRPYSGAVVATGGVPPYQFSLLSGSVPAGMTGPDSNLGTISGTPTVAQFYLFTVDVADSSSPVNHVQNTFLTVVAAAKGRNDSPATATPVAGNDSVSATISPYIDPPNGAPLAADHDYYKITSLSGATVHLETFAKRFNSGDPLDTVLEIVDGNGVRLSNCNVPGNASTTFTSPCMNDDMAAGVQDSALDLKVPGTVNTTTTFYAHVLDWRGDARPDMTYTLNITGGIDPLTIIPFQRTAATRGAAFSGQLAANNGTGALTWSVASGTLPPGVTLSNTGAFGGTTTTDGTYPFTVGATDSGTPPQTATRDITIQVAEPVTITSPATFPTACINQPYSFTPTTSGGVPPVAFSFFANPWTTIFMDQNTGVFSGTPLALGTFHGTLGAGDAAGSSDSQQVTLTVQNCP